MNLLPHIAGRVFATPLMISRAKLDVIVGIIAPRLQGETLPPAAPAAARGLDVGTGGIAVISITGTLVRRTVGLEAQSGLTSYAEIAEQVQQAVADPSVRAILLDLDSPGGEAGGVFDLADQIYAARRPSPSGLWRMKTLSRRPMRSPRPRSVFMSRARVGSDQLA